MCLRVFLLSVMPAAGCGRLRRCLTVAAATLSRPGDAQDMGKKILHFRENEANITALQQTAAARGSLRQNAARIRIQNPNPESESESESRIRIRIQNPNPNPESESGSRIRKPDFFRERMSFILRFCVSQWGGIPPTAAMGYNPDAGREKGICSRAGRLGDRCCPQDGVYRKGSVVGILPKGSGDRCAVERGRCLCAKGAK